MHTQDFGPHARVHYNGDYSGEIYLVVPADWTKPEEGGRISVQVPFYHLKVFIARYVAEARIEAIDNEPDPDVLLGVKVI